MSAVTFYVYDSSDETKNTPVESCTIFVFSSDGSTFITSGDTDASGELTFDLPDAAYWVRFFKVGFSFENRLSVAVSEDDEFEVGGENLETLPPATLSHLCRVSGRVIGAAGQFLPNVTFEFMLNEIIRISGGYATGNAKAIVVSDAVGYLEFDLLRGAVYEVVVESYEPEVFVVTVPDAPSTNITELIWPYLARVDLGETALSMSEGDEEEVAVQAVFSSGLETPYNGISEEVRASSLLSASSSDESVATATLSGGTLTVTAVGTGTCEISFTSGFTAARRVPALDVTLDSIAVTVA